MLLFIIWILLYILYILFNITFEIGSIWRWYTCKAFTNIAYLFLYLWNASKRSLESFTPTSVSIRHYLGYFAITSLSESKEDNRENDSRRLYYTTLSIGNYRDLTQENRLNACLLVQILAFTIMRSLYIRVGYMFYMFSREILKVIFDMDI